MHKMGVILLVLSFTCLPTGKMGVINAVDSRLIRLSASGMSDTGRVSVEPETIIGPPPALNDTFRDSIYITDTPYMDFWNFDISWNPNVLHCLDIIEGPFMDQFGNGLFVYQEIDNIAGHAGDVDCGFLSGGPASGSGTIAYIKWQVVGTGGSVLDLWDVWLALGADLVPSVSVDGYFYLPVGVEENLKLPSARAQGEGKTQISKFEIYPNPFSKKTAISYQLSVKSRVSLKIYDILGRLVKTLVNGESEPGYHSVNWRPETLASELYFLRFEIGSEVITKKMVRME